MTDCPPIIGDDRQAARTFIKALAWECFDDQKKGGRNTHETAVTVGCAAKPAPSDKSDDIKHCFTAVYDSILSRS
jgi:hypothetical protein